MDSVRRCVCIVLSMAGIVTVLMPWSAIGSGRHSTTDFHRGRALQASLYQAPMRGDPQSPASRANLHLETQTDYRVRLAYGRTFGTSTELDYTTVEVSKGVTQYPELWGTALAKGELQMAFLASHVSYKGGLVERIKRLDFQDGYELGVLPKAQITIPSRPLGAAAYLESGAGIGYVSETYRNSGSRWNWSLLAGFGLERNLDGETSFSMGLLWRHLSNGNMWGKGDELHNSNSGTDMIQGAAMLVHRF